MVARDAREQAGVVKGSARGLHGGCGCCGTAWCRWLNARWVGSRRQLQEALRLPVVAGHFRRHARPTPWHYFQCTVAVCACWWWSVQDGAGCTRAHNLGGMGQRGVCVPHAPWKDTVLVTPLTIARGHCRCCSANAKCRTAVHVLSANGNMSPSPLADTMHGTTQD